MWQFIKQFTYSNILLLLLLLDFLFILENHTRKYDFFLFGVHL